jgi:hypothetical protein
MHPLQRLAGVLTLALVTLAVLSGAPLPIDSSLVAVNVTMNSVTGNPATTFHPYRPGSPAESGGGVRATIDGQWSTILWCVDNQNYIHPGDSYDANVTILNAWSDGMNDFVRKGANTHWSDGASLTPLQRYQAAAYMVSQYTSFPNGPNGTSIDTGLQMAIWRLLHSGYNDGDGNQGNPLYTQAVNYITGQGGQTAHPDYGFGQWAVVSGSVSPTGSFYSKCERPLPAYQTFLAQIVGGDPHPSDVPEPSTYVTLGAGLVGLALMRRRRV